MHVATWYEAIVDEQYCGTRDCTIRSIEMSTGANINVIFHGGSDSSWHRWKISWFWRSIYIFFHHSPSFWYSSYRCANFKTKTKNINFIIRNTLTEMKILQIIVSCFSFHRCINKSVINYATNKKWLVMSAFAFIIN